MIEIKGIAPNVFAPVIFKAPATIVNGKRRVFVFPERRTDSIPLARRKAEIVPELCDRDECHGALDQGRSAGLPVPGSSRSCNQDNPMSVGQTIDSKSTMIGGLFTGQV